MAGKKPYAMPMPKAQKPSFTNRLGDAFEDVTDYAKRGLADVTDAYDAVKNKVTRGGYHQGIDRATNKRWPYGRGYDAVEQDSIHKEHLAERKERDLAPPSLPPAPAPPKAPPPKAAAKAKPAAKPAPRTIDAWTADQEWGATGPSMSDKGIKAKPPPGQPGSRKLAPVMEARHGEIVTDRPRPLDPGLKKKLPYMGAKTETVTATVGGKKKTIKVPKAGKVKA